MFSFSPELNKTVPASAHEDADSALARLSIIRVHPCYHQST